MESGKIQKLVNLIERMESTGENREEVEKMKELIEDGRYAEILEILKQINEKEKRRKEEKSIKKQEELKEEPEEDYEEEIEEDDEEDYEEELEEEPEEDYEEEPEEDYEEELEEEPEEEDDDDEIEEELKEDNNVEENQEEDSEDIKYEEPEEEVYEFEQKKDEQNESVYPEKLSNTQLEREYISLLLLNPKAISMYYILNQDCFFESDEYLNLYKSVLFTEGEAFAPQRAKDNYNFAKEGPETYETKRALKEEAKSLTIGIEKVYVELRKLFEIRKHYLRNPIKETQEKIMDIMEYELYDIMTIQEVDDAIEQITVTQKFKRGVLSNNVTDFLILGENNLTSGLELPFPILSSVFKGIRKGETMAYAMPSNSGKSRFTINLAANIAFIHKKKVLIISNEMSEEKMRLCLITTVLNNKKIQELHGQKIEKTEGEILEFKFRPDKGVKAKLDEDGFILKEEKETQREFAKRLSKISEEFRKTIEVTKWLEKQIKNSIEFVNITNHTNDELEKVILNYYYKEKIEYVFYDTLKTDTDNIGNGEELKKTATILSNLAQNLDIFIASSLQLMESNTLPINLNINDLAVSRTVKEVLDTLCLIKQIHAEDYSKYEYSLEEVDTKFYDLEKSKDPDVRYYACVVDKNRAGAKPKVLFRLNLAYNMWEELGYLRLKSNDEEE